MLTCRPNLVDTTTAALHVRAAPEVAAAGIYAATALKQWSTEARQRAVHVEDAVHCGTQ